MAVEAELDPEVEDGVEAELEGAEDDGAEGGADDGHEAEDALHGGEDLDADEDDGQEGRQAAEVAPRRGRGADRFQELSRQNRELRERVERQEREFQAAQAERQRQSQQETERQEQERLALMTDAERFEHYRAKDRQEFGRQLAGLQFQMADSADRTAFEAKAARVPAFAAVADQVETLLASERRQGRNPGREAVATYLVGQKAIERAARANGKQGRQAAAGRQRQQARPAGGRGDVASNRQQAGQADARRRRLEDMEI